MPLLKSGDIEKNEKEISIAQKVSDLVINGQSSNFPLVYGYGQCDNIIFFHSSVFAEQAQYHANIEMRRYVFPDKIKMLDRFERINMPLENIDQRLNITNFPTNFPLRGYFLISELADTDLQKWSQYTHSSEVWAKILIDILMGLRDLRSIGVSHNDLHLGNVLIKYDQNNVMALIHDFGQSQELTINNLTFDLVKFFDSLIDREQVKIPPKINTILLNFIPFLDNILSLDDLEKWTDDLIESLQQNKE